MSAPKGLGRWIWQPKYAEGGDPERVADKCLEYGIGWVAVKAFDGASGVSSLKEAELRGLRGALTSRGLQLFTWHYGYPSSW